MRKLWSMTDGELVAGSAVTDKNGEAWLRMATTNEYAWCDMHGNRIRWETLAGPHYAPLALLHDYSQSVTV
jgi:hypothetical protein